MKLSCIWNKECPNIKLLQRFLLLLLSEMFTKLSFRSVQDSSVMHYPTFFALTHFFRVGFKFFNVKKWPRVLQCNPDAPRSVMAPQKCKVWFLCVCSIFHVIILHIFPHQHHTSHVVSVRVCLNNFCNAVKFLAKIFSRLQPHTTASRDRLWWLAAVWDFLSENNRRRWCYAEHLLLVWNEAVNLKNTVPDLLGNLFWPCA